jgi:hypothetical protein
MLGLREVTIVATVVLVLYGRSGVLRSRRFQSIWPWISPVRRKPARPGAAADPGRDIPGPSSAPAPKGGALSRKPRLFQLEGNRLFWFLTILAATAVATAIVSRMLILRDAGPVSTH